ncbi:MAG TPA: SDR family NAD(P)-dependent oxidoreductase [Myxococcaceae bacterium]|jgi:NAD(P)-dependent dehydrogenase (short-subunit alcohol dehydrogenase family)|nr:SDR family NAD(P)-dependent oxidoreductase [Myxococcaceae bacterium]
MGDRLRGKVAIVAGAGSVAPGWSNGKATAVLFAREGAKVFAIDRDLELARETFEAIRAEGGECVLHAADVSIEAEVARGVAACLQRYGRVDVLFNNVGIQAVGGPERIDEATWDRVMAVNVKSMYLTCRHALPVMVRQRGGAIVNNSSITSIRFAYPCLPYSVSKGAVNELTRSIAMQYAQHGIRANAVVPGLMATPRITKRLQETYGPAYQDQLKARDELVPLGRMGDAWDVAHAVLFLASDEAKYVTGTELIVDGGLSASLLGRPWRD